MKGILEFAWNESRRIIEDYESGKTSWEDTSKLLKARRIQSEITKSTVMAFMTSAKFNDPDGYERLKNTLIGTNKKINFTLKNSRPKLLEDRTPNRGH